MGDIHLANIEDDDDTRGQGIATWWLSWDRWSIRIYVCNLKPQNLLIFLFLDVNQLLLARFSEASTVDAMAGAYCNLSSHELSKWMTVCYPIPGVFRVAIISFSRYSGFKYFLVFTPIAANWSQFDEHDDLLWIHPRKLTARSPENHPEKEHHLNHRPPCVGSTCSGFQGSTVLIIILQTWLTNQKDHIFFNLPNFPTMKLQTLGIYHFLTFLLITARKSGPTKKLDSVGRYCPIGDVSGFSNCFSGCFKWLHGKPPNCEPTTAGRFASWGSAEAFPSEADLGVELPGRVGGVLPGKRLCGGRRRFDFFFGTTDRGVGWVEIFLLNLWKLEFFFHEKSF